MMGEIKNKIFIAGLIILYLCTSNILAEDYDILNTNEAFLKSIKAEGFPFFIYTDSSHYLNHYSPSGWMGDCSDLNFIDNWKKNPKYGRTCIKIKYSAKKIQHLGWAGIYWQNPVFNWGYYNDIFGGYDLTGAEKLYFYARGKKGEEVVGFKIGGIRGDNPDSTTGSMTIWLTLTKKWKLYEIDIAGLDLSYIIGGFCIIFSSDKTPNGCTIYLDEIYYFNKNVPYHLISFFKEMNAVKDNNKNKLKIAVMEFKNNSCSKDHNYLTKVISEEIGIYLGKKDGIWVIDSNNVNNLIKNIASRIDIDDVLNPELFVKDLLEVDILVEGSFIENNNQIQINICAIDRETKEVIASKKVKGEIGKDMFLLLESMTKSVFTKISKFKKNKKK